MATAFLGLAAVLTALAPPVSAGSWGDAPPSDPAQSDRARMQGVWAMTEMVVNGTAATQGQMRLWLLVVEGDVYNPGSGETSLEYVFRIDPTRTPKAIDLVPRLQASGRQKYYRGIYSLTDDTLTICRPLDIDEDRPAGFSARAGSNMARVVWRRRKAP
jgi:uncharacterized protein (TIGR03067 family)